MAFGDEELWELRTQLIAAGEPHDEGERSRALQAIAEAPGGKPASEPAQPAAAAAGIRDHAPPVGDPGSLDGPRERDEFLAMLGHELRNPLAPMQQAVELLQAHATGDDPPHLRQARTVLVRQVEHLRRLVDVLLDVDHRVGAAKDPSDAPAAEALVRRVVSLHGGRVTTREHGGELELHAWLPAAPPEDVPVEPAAAATPPRARPILVVDDAEMLALVLRKRGFEVELAFDGEEALSMARSHQPEIVLLDIGLPGIDGYEVARRLRSRLGPEELLLVAVTGYGQPADRQRAREAGFDHHLVKPVAMEQLLPLLEAPAGR